MRETWEEYWTEIGNLVISRYKDSNTRLEIITLGHMSWEMRFHSPDNGSTK